MLPLMLLVLAAGCEKDTDCKGDRVCEVGRCVSPGALAAPMPADAGVPASTTPPAASPGRAPLRVGEGEVSARPVAPPSIPAPPEPPSRVVGLVGVTGGLMAAGSVLGAAVGATGSVGVRFRSGVGVVGVGLIDYSPADAATTQLYGVGAGVRFGDRSQFTLAGLPTIEVTTVKVLKTTVTGTAFGFSLLAQGALVLVDILTVFAQATLGLDTTAAVTFALSAGVGLSF